VRTGTPVAATAEDGGRLNSRAVVILTGCSYAFVGLGFSYLDRRFDAFPLESSLWLFWALLGFGAGTYNLRKPVGAGQTQWLVCGALGALLAFFPGLAIYNLLRWVSLTLMVVVGARAAVLRARRDFHFTLAAVFVVSFMVGTHGNADWTLWFYLGPAWTCAALALAWDHVARATFSRRTTLLMTLGFIGASFWLAVLLFFVAPRPPILGFGFLPPAADAPGLLQSMGGKSAQPGDVARQGAPGVGGGVGDGGLAPQATWALQWEAMLKSMRKSAADPKIPRWQRRLMETMLDAAQSIPIALAVQRVESPEASQQTEPFQDRLTRLALQINWKWLLALALGSYLLWRRRYRLGLNLVLGGAWLMARYRPVLSMRLTALAMKWCLHQHGYRRSPGQSVREHWMATEGIAPLARRWLCDAMEVYCTKRFGGQPATVQQALDMRKSVLGACEILMGAVPELARPDGAEVTGRNN